MPGNRASQAPVTTGFVGGSDPRSQNVRVSGVGEGRGAGPSPASGAWGAMGLDPGKGGALKGRPIDPGEPSPSIPSSHLDQRGTDQVDGFPQKQASVHLALSLPLGFQPLGTGAQRRPQRRRESLPGLRDGGTWSPALGGACGQFKGLSIFSVDRETPLGRSGIS